VNAGIRRAVKARGHFPNEQAALKCVDLAVMSLDPTGTGSKRWTMRWKPALNAFEIAFDGRLTAGRNHPSSTRVTPFVRQSPRRRTQPTHFNPSDTVLLTDPGPACPAVVSGGGCFG
jgi:hypothetical protein